MADNYSDFRLKFEQMLHSLEEVEASYLRDMERMQDAIVKNQRQIAELRKIIVSGMTPYARTQTVEEKNEPLSSPYINTHERSGRQTGKPERESSDPEPVIEMEEAEMIEEGLSDGKNERILGDLFEGSRPEWSKKEEPAWMTDMPGLKIDSIQEGVSINDRLFFINELFDSDEDQYELTIERIDGMHSLREVLSEMRETFPEWDENSDAVYRFYMTVRRRFV